MPDPGVIYTVYSTNGPIVDITGNDAPLYLYYQAQGDNGRAPHPALPISATAPIGAQDMGWAWFFSAYDLPSVMNQMWADAIPGLDAHVRSLTSHLGFGVTLRPNIPASGSVRAVASPGLTGQYLVLDYWVPVSYEIDLEIKEVHPVVRASFDVEILILLQIWAWPEIQVQASASLHNADVHIINAGSYLLEGLSWLVNEFAGFTGSVENQINSANVPNPDVSSLTSGLLSLAQVALPFGLKQCMVSVDPHARQLSVTMMHPPDPPPIAYNPAQTQFGFGNDPSLGLTQYQVKSGADLGVIGTGFPSTAEVAVAWYPSSSGYVQQSFVTWGPGDGQSVTVEGAASEYSLPDAEEGETYNFQVRNFDGLQTTPPSNVVSITAFGVVDLVLAYSAPGPIPLGGNPTAPHSPQLLTQPVATVPENPGAFTLPITIPANALPGLATLIARSNGQTLATVEFTIVGYVRPQIYAYNPSTGTVMAPQFSVGQTIYVNGEGFTPNANVKLYIDQVARAYLQATTQMPVQADGSFSLPITWPTATDVQDEELPPTLANLGNHTIIAHQIGVPAIQVSMMVSVWDPNSIS